MPPIPSTGPADGPTDGPTLRREWIDLLSRVARPVLSAAAERRLRRDMPVEQSPATRGTPRDRGKFSHFEAVARTLCGVAPYLETDDDSPARSLARSAREAVHNLFEPGSPDLVDLTAGGQILVDAAFLARAFLDAPRTLWHPLDPPTRARVVDAFKTLRSVLPGFSNWLLFPATIEAFLHQAGESADPVRVDYALRQHEQWFVGGGWYKDGPAFHHDYYNSIVIQPMLLHAAEVMQDQLPWVKDMLPAWSARAGRHAELLERLIAPDGTYPLTGRSLTYRCGVFHLPAWLALHRRLPASLPPAQVRTALTAVIRRTLLAPHTFDDNGWLTIGLSGRQPSLGETYISTGSLYLCTAAFLPLGLPATDPFWTDPPLPLTWQRAWAGTDLPPDHD